MAEELAKEIGKTFAAFGVLPSVVAAFAKAVDGGRVVPAPDALPAQLPAPLPAPLGPQLDSLFSPPGEVQLLNTKSEVWRGLPWRTGIRGTLPNIGVVEIVGPTGMYKSEQCRGGVMFQIARHHYAWHRHAAEEFYLPVFGAAKWLAEGKAAEVVAPLQKTIHHQPWQAHAMETAAAPLLALWLWTGDLSFDKYELCPPPE